MSTGGRHQVAVIRVEVGAGETAEPLIELLEVGDERRSDRVIGRTTDPAEAGALIDRWLRGLSRP